MVTGAVGVDARVVDMPSTVVGDVVTSASVEDGDPADPVQAATSRLSAIAAATDLPISPSPYAAGRVPGTALKAVRRSVAPGIGHRTDRQIRRKNERDGEPPRAASRRVAYRGREMSALGAR